MQISLEKKVLPAFLQQSGYRSRRIGVVNGFFLGAQVRIELVV